SVGCSVSKADWKKRKRPAVARLRSPQIAPKRMLVLEKFFGIAAVSRSVVSHSDDLPNSLMARLHATSPVTNRYFRTNRGTTRNSEIILPALESVITAPAIYFISRTVAKWLSRHSIPETLMARSLSDGGEARQKSS